MFYYINQIRRYRRRPRLSLLKSQIELHNPKLASSLQEPPAYIRRAYRHAQAAGLQWQPVKRDGKHRAPKQRPFSLLQEQLYFWFEECGDLALYEELAASAMSSSTTEISSDQWDALDEDLADFEENGGRAPGNGEGKGKWDDEDSDEEDADEWDALHDVASYTGQQVKLDILFPAHFVYPEGDRSAIEILEEAESVWSLSREERQILLCYATEAIREEADEEFVTAETKFRVAREKLVQIKDQVSRFISLRSLFAHSSRIVSSAGPSRYHAESRYHRRYYERCEPVQSAHRQSCTTCIDYRGKLDGS